MLYILFSDLSIGVLEGICTCEECKERKELELIIIELNGAYKDYIKLDDVFNSSEVITISDNLNSLINLQSQMQKKGELIAKFLQQEMLKSK